MATKLKKYTVEEVLGINAALSVLLSKEVTEVSVSVCWDLVIIQNTIKPIVKTINELGGKINKAFYTRPEKEGENFKIIPGKEEEVEKAEEELNSKTFELELPCLKFDDLKDIPGIKGLELLRLHPIIIKS